MRKSSLLFHGSFKQSLNESWWYLESYVLYCDECLSGSKSPSLARRSSDVKCNEYTLLLLFKIRQDCCTHHGNVIVALDDSLTEQIWKWNIRFLFVVKEHFLFSWQILWREWHKSIWAKIVLENVYWHATNVINKKLITLNYYIWQWKGDKWRLPIRAQTFPGWHLAFRTISVWTFGAGDISRPRFLAPGH